MSGFVCEATLDGKACCDNEAGFLYRSPWAQKYLCHTHADEHLAARKSNVRVPMVELSKLEFLCDWVGDGDEGTCGAKAEWFQEHPDGYQRPLCKDHAPATGSAARILRVAGAFNSHFDPKKVPYKPEVHVPRYLSAPPKPAEPPAVIPPRNRWIRVDDVWVCNWCGDSTIADGPCQAPEGRTAAANIEAMVDEAAERTGQSQPTIHPLPSMVPTSPLPPPMPPRGAKSVKSAFAELAAAVLDEAKRRVERWR